jgi:hypothetical protein
MSVRRVWRRRRQSPRKRRKFTRLLLIYGNICKIATMQRSTQAAFDTIKTQHTAARRAANEATPEIIVERIELLGNVCVLQTIEAVPMCVADERAKLIYPDHRLLPGITEDASRDRSNRLSDPGGAHYGCDGGDSCARARRNRLA